MPKGDCFTKAWEVLGLLLARDLDAYLVHGTPVYQGAAVPDLPGGRFHHAWVEVDLGELVMVHDYSGDRELVMGREAYYGVGRIDPELHTTEYDYVAAVYQMVEFGHYGPWDGSVPPVTD